MRLLALFLFFTSLGAQADVYKCIEHDGKISFSSHPCASTDGVSEYQDAASKAGQVSAGSDGAEAAQRSKRAAEIMLQGKSYGRPRNQVVVVPDSTSGMAAEQREREARALRSKNRAPRTTFNCYSYGSERQFTTCR